MKHMNETMKKKLDMVIIFIGIVIIVVRENPLMQYSTSQLKAELRRRKKERC